MNFFKTIFLFLVIMIFAFNLANAKDDPLTMHAVHTDNVKFDTMLKYEELAKQLKESCETYNIQDVNWKAIHIEHARYVHVIPIKNMAELDKNPTGSLDDKMNKDDMGNMFDAMNTCYDSHSDAIIHQIQGVSYSPEGHSLAGKNPHEYDFIYDIR
jgi:hypothetical protein